MKARILKSCFEKKLVKSISGIGNRTRELDTNQQQTPKPYISAYCASLLEQCCSKEGRSISYTQKTAVLRPAAAATSATSGPKAPVVGAISEDLG